MYWRLHRRTRSRLRRTAIALFLAANHLVVALGVPIPMPSADPQSSGNQPFPCMNCPCGCRTAERCWRNCCCFTMSQKLAWAKAHGVTPPAFVLEASAREGTNTDGSKPCCPHCHKKAAAKPVAGKHDARQGDYVVLLKAMECEGSGPLGLLSSSPALIPPPVSFVPGETRVLGFVSCLVPALVSSFAEVPVPPPRG